MPQQPRRRFLQLMTAATALTSFPSRGRSSLLAAPPPDDEAYWQAIRMQFAFSEEKVPMNAANLCPSFRSVSDRVTELTRDVDVDCSFDNRAKFVQFRESSRSKVAALLGVSNDEIALVRNTSEANNIVNNGLQLAAGDEILAWDQNHPTNNVAWDVRAARFSYRVRKVSTPLHPHHSGELAAPFEEAMTDRTRVLAITHLSNVSGIRLPIAVLCEMAHRRGIHVHVDGAQTWGALNVNLRDLGCDSYAASAHKWFMGPKEVGLLYVRRESIDRIWPGTVAPGWGSGVQTELIGARKFESLGQRDDSRLAAVATAADLHRMIGPSQIEARIHSLASELKSGLRELGLRLVTPMEPELSGGVCIAEIPSQNRRTLLSRLYQEHGIAGAATGGVRLCPHIYNTRDHLRRALKGIAQING